MRLMESYMEALAADLHVRGRLRRRFLDECREHLTNAATDRGEHHAVLAFGPAATIADAFDAEAATQRALRATSLTVIGVLMTGASTLALIQGAEPGATAPALWAIMFFVAAQLAGTAVALASLQGLAQRHETIASAELSLLCRRDLTALVSAGATMFAAGAAVPGQASALALMAGPSSSAWRSRRRCVRGIWHAGSRARATSRHDRRWRTAPTLARPSSRADPHAPAHRDHRPGRSRRLRARPRQHAAPQALPRRPVSRRSPSWSALPASGASPGSGGAPRQPG